MALTIVVTVQRHLSQRLSSSRIYCSGYLRILSTDSNRESIETESPFRQRWNYFKGVVQSFVKGMRLLVADVKQVRQLRRKIGWLKIDGTPPTINSDIRWEDIQFIAKTRSDLKRTFPTLVLFCIPLLGYIAPFLALAFPGQLLSSHFWSEEQKKAFDKKNKEFRAKNMKLLSQHLSLEKSNLELSSSLKECLDKIKMTSQNEEERWDWIGESQIVSMNLNALPSQHLRLLCSSWGVQSFVPFSWWLRQKLTSHLNYIYYGDHLLQAYFPSTEQLVQVLNERNIEINSELETKLKLWLSVTTVHKVCPHVLIGHLPLLWYNDSERKT